MIDGIKMNRIKEIMNKKSYDKFVSWMRGQTMGIDSEGNDIVYCDDFIRFLNKLQVVE